MISLKNKAALRQYLYGMAQAYMRACHPRTGHFRLPGRASANGRKIDNLETFARLSPLLALLGQVDDGPGRACRRFLGDRLKSGLTPDAPSAWGAPTDYDQMICEASDIALALWFARDWLSDGLEEGQKARLLTWLRQMLAVKVRDNNWHLFHATIAAVLYRLDGDQEEGLRTILDQKLERVASFRDGQGLFRDGPAGEVDYYSFWGFHYNLGMLETIFGQELWVDFSRDRQKCYEILLSLVTQRGLPIFGRSVHYRMGAVAPLAISALHDHASETPVGLGQIKRAIRLVWQWFEQQGAVTGGLISRGYYQRDDDLVENYGGPGSPLWCLRSLIPLLLLEENHSFWTCAEVPLPIEKGNYRRSFGAGGWQIIGDSNAGDVRIETTFPPDGDKAFLRPTLAERMKAVVRGQIYLPKNFEARYRRSHYSSAAPFFDS